MADPISDAESALEALVVPVSTGDPSLPASWKDQTPTPPAGDPLSIVKILLTVLYGISNDVKTVGTDVGTALTDVAKAADKIADTLTSPPVSSASDITSAMAALKTGLSLAQTIMPGSSDSLKAISGFFDQVNQLLTTVTGDVNKAAILLYKLAQQLTAISTALTPA